MPGWWNLTNVFIASVRVSKGMLEGSLLAMKQWSGSIFVRSTSVLGVMPGKAPISPVGTSFSSVSWCRFVQTVALVPSIVGLSVMLK